MTADDAKRLKGLEKENARLKRLVADQALDVDMLKEANPENFSVRFAAGRECHGRGLPPAQQQLPAPLIAGLLDNERVHAKLEPQHQTRNDSGPLNGVRSAELATLHWAPRTAPGNPYQISATGTFLHRVQTAIFRR